MGTPSITKTKKGIPENWIIFNTITTSHELPSKSLQKNLEYLCT